jgi:hypothetical protein
MMLHWDRASQPMRAPDDAPGRIILGRDTTLTDLAPGAWLSIVGGRERFAQSIRPVDVAWVPLLRSQTDELVAREWDAIHDYAEHCALIREIAPHCAGVLIGNMGPEFCGHQGAGGHLFTRESVEFVQRAGELVREAGGVPWFGSIDWTLLMDCYERRAIRDAVREVGGVQVCFTGFSVSDRCWFDRSFHHWRLQRDYQRRRSGPKTPSDELVAYLSSVPVWSCCNGTGGLEHGNETALREAGYCGIVLNQNR